VTWGNENTGNQGSAGRATIYNPNTGNATTIGGIKGQDGGVININGHVIAGSDGNYYRPDGSGGWEQVTRPSGGNASAMPANANVRAQQQINQTRQWQQSNVNVQQQQALNNEFQARQMGAQRQQSFQMNRPAFRGGGGGGRRR
jgi:hypothetical protein